MLLPEAELLGWVTNSKQWIKAKIYLGAQVAHGGGVFNLYGVMGECVHVRIWYGCMWCMCQREVCVCERCTCVRVISVSVECMVYMFVCECVMCVQPSVFVEGRSRRSGYRQSFLEAVMSELPVYSIPVRLSSPHSAERILVKFSMSLSLPNLTLVSSSSLYLPHWIPISVNGTCFT